MEKYIDENKTDPASLFPTVIKAVFSRWARRALDSLSGGEMEYVVTVVNGGCEPCWAGANQSDSQGLSEHIIVYEEAEALFPATITQTLKGPVGPPWGLVSDALENEPPCLHCSL